MRGPTGFRIRFPISDAHCITLKPRRQLVNSLQQTVLFPTCFLAARPKQLLRRNVRGAPRRPQKGRTFGVRPCCRPKKCTACLIPPCLYLKECQATGRGLSYPGNLSGPTQAVYQLMHGLDRPLVSHLFQSLESGEDKVDACKRERPTKTLLLPFAQEARIGSLEPWQQM